MGERIPLDMSMWERGARQGWLSFARSGGRVETCPLMTRRIGVSSGTGRAVGCYGRTVRYDNRALELELCP